MLMTRKLPDPTLSMEKSRFSSDTTTSPRSPLDIQIRSPCRVLNNCRIRDGVGLGIVAALDKSGSSEAAVKLILDSLSLTRSNSIPIGSAKPDMGDWDDEYTCVTSHGPNNKSGALQRSSQSSFEEFPTSGFLSSCYLCRKKLHGKDIYMYRGEKAFCSTECRYKQIVSDERKEKCRSKASRSLDVLVSPHSRGQLFSTGIFAV